MVKKLLPKAVWRLLSILIIEAIVVIVDNTLFKRLHKEAEMSKDKKEHEHIHCEVCYLQNENSPDVKFHLYEEDTCYSTDKYVCDKCLKWVHMMRKLASEQSKKPESDPFENVDWWWQPKKEGISAAEMHVK